MKKYIFLFFICLFVVFAETETEDEKVKKKDPFQLTSPEGWRSERIPFPLSFAPDIDFVGFEEIRFAPGMFEPKAKDYFSYVFFFWIEKKVEIKAADVNICLLKYYKGLCKVVSEKRNLNLDISKIEVETETTEKNKFMSTVKWYDPFVTGKKLTLHMEIDFFYSPDKKNSVLFACVSPIKFDVKKDLWKKMHKIRESFEFKKK